VRELGWQWSARHQRGLTVGGMGGKWVAQAAWSWAAETSGVWQRCGTGYPLITRPITHPRSSLRRLPVAGGTAAVVPDVYLHTTYVHHARTQHPRPRLPDVLHARHLEPVRSSSDVASHIPHGPSISQPKARQGCCESMASLRLASRGRSGAGQGTESSSPRPNLPTSSLNQYPRSCTCLCQSVEMMRTATWLSR
jgi:hypothetical protein